MYQIYWFWKNWALYKARPHDEDIWPIPRGIFTIFFAHSLADLISRSLSRDKHKLDWDEHWAASIYVVTTLMGGLCDRLAAREMGSPFTDLLSLALLPVTGWAIYTFQRAINMSCGQPEGSTNRTYSAANWLWIVIGILLWALILIGTVDAVRSALVS